MAVATTHKTLERGDWQVRRGVDFTLDTMYRDTGNNSKAWAAAVDAVASVRDTAVRELLAHELGRTAYVTAGGTKDYAAAVEAIEKFSDAVVKKNGDVVGVLELIEKWSERNSRMAVVNSERHYELRGTIRQR